MFTELDGQEEQEEKEQQFHSVMKVKKEIT